MSESKGPRSRKPKWRLLLQSVLPAVLVTACESPLPPAACGAISRVTVHAGEQTAVTACFNDPNGDVLTYSVSTANTSVATASISGITITVIAVAPGNASVTVTATDPGGLQGQQSFQVEVPNRPPVARGTIPRVTVQVGGTESVDVSSYFTDPDGEALTYGAASSSPAVAAVSVASSAIRVTAVAKGTATVTVTATDPGGLAATQTFLAMVPNRRPEPVGTIPDETVEVGDPISVDLSPYFNDPDGDALRYAATSSRTGVAGVSVSGSVVTITARAKGTTDVTITATDDEGLSATQTFRSTVPNRPPKTTSSIPSRTLEAGETSTINASNYFTDPDGDALTYTGRSSNTGVARVSVSGSTVTITAVSPGSATITITARDPGGLTATQRASVTVTQSNRAPRAVGTISAVTLAPGGTATINASNYFTDPDGDALTYTAQSSNTGVARVSASGATVTITGVANGSATITITARDPGGLTATQRAGVTVTQGNRAPRAVGTIPAVTLAPGGTTTINASNYFTDPDGDALTYTASSSNTGVARVSVSGATVTITAVAAGSATVTITARDPGGLTATQRASVTVTQQNRAPRAVGTIPAVTLAAGETSTIDASPYFTDPDGDALTYTANSSSRGVAAVSVSGSTVMVTAVGAGNATITITARDPGGLTAQSAFPVDVIGGDPGYVIELVLATAMTSAQETAFREAAEQWMSILADTELPDVPVDGTIDCDDEYEQTVDTIDDLMIVAAVVEIDGPGGTLGAAGPCWIRSELGLPFFGRMVFDVADMEFMEREGLLKPVILHEMGHVLGIGVLWDYDAHDLLRNPSSASNTLDTHFTGQLAIEAFDSAGGADYTGAKVPVENTGGRGTINSHWRRSVFGNELMIGWASPGAPLSAITIQSLADMGYTVDTSLAEAYRLPDAATAASMLKNAIKLENDIINVPIVVVDRNGRIVRVIPPN